MWRNLIEALTYPKLLVLRSIDAKACLHDNRLHAISEVCCNCDVSQQCHWARSLDDFEYFEAKPSPSFDATLRYGAKLVETLRSEFEHDETPCSCESCEWIRHMQRLTEEFEAYLVAIRTFRTQGSSQPL